MPTSDNNGYQSLGTATFEPMPQTQQQREYDETSDKIERLVHRLDALTEHVQSMAHALVGELKSVRNDIDELRKS